MCWVVGVEGTDVWSHVVGIGAGMLLGLKCRNKRLTEDECGTTTLFLQFMQLCRE